MSLKQLPLCRNRCSIIKKNDTRVVWLLFQIPVRYGKCLSIWTNCRSMIQMFVSKSGSKSVERFAESVSSISPAEALPSRCMTTHQIPTKLCQFTRWGTSLLSGWRQHWLMPTNWMDNMELAVELPQGSKRIALGAYESSVLAIVAFWLQSFKHQQEGVRQKAKCIQLFLAHSLWS